jgi:hypothetical protein
VPHVRMSVRGPKKMGRSPYDRFSLNPARIVKVTETVPKGRLNLAQHAVLGFKR